MSSIHRVKELADVKYKVLYEARYHNRHVSIGFCQTEVMPWAVGYGGNSHYFKTLPEAVAYSAGRDFIPFHMMDSITKSIMQKLEMVGS